MYQKVRLAADCIFEDWDEDGEYPICPEHEMLYADCPCVGPHQDDEHDYEEVDGILMAKKKN